MNTGFFKNYHPVRYIRFFIDYQRSNLCPDLLLPEVFQVLLWPFRLPSFGGFQERVPNIFLSKKTWTLRGWFLGACYWQEAS